MPRSYRLAIAVGLLFLGAALYWGVKDRLPWTEALPSSDSVAANRPRIPADVVQGDSAWSVGTSRAARLETAVRALFALDTDSLHEACHFLARTTETLSLDSTAVSEGVAHVYLHGRLTGLRGVCDHPRARIQVEETARPLPFVDRVVLYRNGRRTDLTPSGRGELPEENSEGAAATPDEGSTADRPAAHPARCGPSFASIPLPPFRTA